MKRAVRILIPACLILALTGCSSGLTIFSNYRRIENIELVRTVTADKRDDGVNVSIYGTAGERSEARMYEKSGPSIGVAMGELILMPLGREAILSHTETMLIGEDLARESIRECLDYVERFSEMRLDTGILIVRDGTARDLVNGLSGEDTPASDIISGISRNIARVGEGYFFTCREIAASMAENGYALIQCVRGVEEEQLFDARGELNMEPAGFAVAEDGRVREFLTDEETLGAMLLLGKYKSRNVDLEMDGATVTVSVDLVRTEFEPVYKKGELEGLEISMEFRANVIGVSGPVDILSDGVRARCEEELTGIMTGAARAAVRRGQAMGVDFMDLGGIIRRKDPRSFDEARWERLYPTLPVEIEGGSTLARTYDIDDPPELSKKEDRKPWEKLIESLKGS